MPHALPHQARSAELHALGLKVTLPRLRVLEVFQRAQPPHHLSAEEVFRTLIDQGCDISLGTVYRVLLQFERAGLLLRQHFEDGRSVFELDPGQHHDHLVCVVCGRIEEFVDLQIEARQERLAADRGFALRAHALVLYGICSAPACRAHAGSR